MPNFFDILPVMKLLALLLISITSLFALVSIAPVEIGDKPGTHGVGAVSLESKRGNTDKNNYKASVRITYDDNVSAVTWGEVSGEYGDTNYQKNTDNLYAHVRHITKIDDKNLRAEYFGQIQNDEFKLIKDRFLLGAGIRYKLFELLNNISTDVFKDSKGYVGLGGFYEYIDYTSQDSCENNIRLNAYFGYTMKLEEKVSFSYAFYYQPKIYDFKDYVSSNKLELKVHIYKKLFLAFNLFYETDSKPPAGVKTDDYGQLTNFIFEF
ncbi:DUF481 domain-containing protein [bacterium]|nr:DUF481 domain-containing protein [bacterium]MBU1994993.1 DUF481 domain-containing protein [bacterium]